MSERQNLRFQPTPTSSSVSCLLSLLPPEDDVSEQPHSPAFLFLNCSFLPHLPHCDRQEPPTTRRKPNQFLLKLFLVGCLVTAMRKGDQQTVLWQGLTLSLILDADLAMVVVFHKQPYLKWKTENWLGLGLLSLQQLPLEAERDWTRTQGHTPKDLKTSPQALPHNCFIISQDHDFAG